MSSSKRYDRGGHGETFDHGYTTGNKGTGLGLSIGKDGVDPHNGEIRIIESGEGAHFESTGVETMFRAD